MKAFTNKYPILGGLILNEDDFSFDKSVVKVEFEEGRVFKVVGINFGSFILECDGRIVEIRAQLFSLSFTETDLDI